MPGLSCRSTEFRKLGSLQSGACKSKAEGSYDVSVEVSWRIENYPRLNLLKLFLEIRILLLVVCLLKTFFNFSFCSPDDARTLLHLARPPSGLALSDSCNGSRNAEMTGLYNLAESVR